MQLRMYHPKLVVRREKNNAREGEDKVMRRGVNFDGCWLSTSIGICLNQECKYPSWSDIWWFWLPATTLLIQICVYLSRLLCLNKILNLRRNFSAHLACLMVLTLCYRETYFQIEIEKRNIEEWSKPLIIHYAFVGIFFSSFNSCRESVWS